MEEDRVQSIEFIEIVLVILLIIIVPRINSEVINNMKIHLKIYSLNLEVGDHQMLILKSF